MIIAVLQARASSSRLPGKVLKPILGKPMLQLQIDRIKQCAAIDRLVLATSDQPDDQPIHDLGKAQGVDVFRGSLDDVLDRFYRASLPFRAEHVIRLTGDCPLIDPDVIAQVVKFHLEGDFDYSSNGLDRTFPDGLDTEIMKAEALEIAWKEARLGSERQHVTPFLYKHRDRFKVGSYRQAEDLSRVRLTVDEPEDFKLISEIFAAFSDRPATFRLADVMKFLRSKPELLKLNSHIALNAGYQASLAKD